MLSKVRRRYADFGPTLACEHLVRDGLELNRETLRQWMSEAGLWRPRRRRLKAVHTWRPRRASFGELVMADGSPFDWLEGRGPELNLIAMIDDATSRCASAVGLVRCIRIDPGAHGDVEGLAEAVWPSGGSLYR